LQNLGLNINRSKTEFLPLVICNIYAKIIQSDTSIKENNRMNYSIGKRSGLIIGKSTAPLMAKKSSLIPSRKKVKKIACLGDSTTYGSIDPLSGIQSYPQHLAWMLGSGWQVENFGVPGTTALLNGDKPYWAEKRFLELIPYCPDVVVILLEKNDTKPQNWVHQNNFLNDYGFLVDKIRSLIKKAEIYLCFPLPVFGDNDLRISNSEILEIILNINTIANDQNLNVIDTYSPFIERRALFPNSVHPNEEGYKILAQCIHDALMGTEQYKTRSRELRDLSSSTT